MDGTTFHYYLFGSALWRVKRSVFRLLPIYFKSQVIFGNYEELPFSRVHERHCDTSIIKKCDYYNRDHFYVSLT